MSSPTDAHLKDARSAVRALADRHPDWSQRRIARELGKSNHFVRKWIVRDNSECLSRGNTQTPSVRNESFDKKVKRKMVGTVKAAGGGKRRYYLIFALNFLSAKRTQTTPLLLIYFPVLTYFNRT